MLINTSIYLFNQWTWFEVANDHDVTYMILCVVVLVLNLHTDRFKSSYNDKNISQWRTMDKSKLSVLSTLNLHLASGHYLSICVLLKNSLHPRLCCSLQAVPVAIWKLQKTWIKRYKNFLTSELVIHWPILVLKAASHTRTVVRECFKGDEASLWKRPKFDPSPHQNPLTDLHKNWQAWLRPGRHPACKIL